MSPVPFRHRPAFRALLCAIALGAVWLYEGIFHSGWRASLGGIVVDIVAGILLALGFLFFYAQFSLPVRRLADRWELFSRVLLHARDAHGAAIFIKNGRKVERRGESRRSGPGLLWIDTASAAMTRPGNGPARVLGPGIHFLGRAEGLEATFSLHAQTYSVGPGQDEPVFDRLPEGATDEQRRRHAAMQTRRQMVSGLTRDGNEVVPEIRIVFKLEGAPAKPGQLGSRFGFWREAVERAARGEGVNVDPVTARRSQVPWNQLPGLLAVDLWREYLAKFTLEELFTSKFGAISEVLQPQEVVAGGPAPAKTGGREPRAAANALGRLNNSIERWLAKQGGAAATATEEPGSQQPVPSLRQAPGREYTGLQIIAYMVKARMMLAAVPMLDEYGRYLKGHTTSEEHRRLRERGIRVMDVTIGGYRFDPAVEAQIVQQWRSAWQANAAVERGHVEQMERLATEAGKQRALLEHAAILGEAIRRDPAASVPAALKALLEASHAELLTDERLHGSGDAQLEALIGLAKWVDSPGDE